jgi:putative oxygen-independent coproporphyrinogen III oxidase
VSLPPPRASLYVHFPWCLAKCPYCDFVSYATPREAIDHVGYADAVIRELDARAAFVRGTRPLVLGSVFFGGGTPSLWEAVELGRVLAAAKERFEVAGDLEVTVECNPTSLDRARAEALHAVGVDRLSIGTQSLRQDQLKFLGRLHDASGARAAIDGALASGIPRVSTDMIFGLPGQTPEDARDQATTLADLGLAHLSCYQLTIEPGTQFGELAKRGRLPLADDGLVAESFLAIDEALSGRGLAHYEISNYARPGEEARHNLGYWRGEEYVGVGCGAFGMLREGDAGDGAARGLRYRNAIDPRKYVEATREVKSDRVGEGDGLSLSSEPLDGEALLRERIMLGLRLATGIDLGAHGRALGVEGWTPERTREVLRLASRGRVVREGDCLRIPRGGWLWTDDTAARLF